MAGALWRHRDFLLLWLGQSVSRFGDQFTGLAIPVIAAYYLLATPAEMGYLGAANTVPFLLFGLVVGVWVDRRQRRSVLIVADLARGSLVAIVGSLGLLSLLQFSFLYVFAFVVGVLTVFFDVAYQAYLPSLVERKNLVEGNSKLETTSALASVAGPTLAGAIIQVLSAPAAMIFDALSFYFSAGTLGAIRKREPPPAVEKHPSILSDIREGLAIVVGDPRLRSIAACTASANFFSSVVFNALIILYLKDVLGIGPFGLGLLFGVSSVGGLVGAISVKRVTDRIRVGPAIVVGAVLFGVPLIPFPFLNGTLAYYVLLVGAFISFFGNLLYNINQVSFRQAVVPDRLQGRLNATMRTIVWGTLPLGALTGGYLGTVLGLRPAVIIGVVGTALAFLFVLLSPVRKIQSIPEHAES
jgi:MFS family permease